MGKTKQRVKEKIRYEASRLLKVQAERSLKKDFLLVKIVKCKHFLKMNLYMN